MSSRGAKIKCEADFKEFITVDNVYDAKILKGSSNKIHSLPDYSKSQGAIYIKYEEDGSFREMRFYNSENASYLEIAYHPEPKLSESGRDRQNPILHYHIIDYSNNFKRSEPFLLDENDDYYKLAEKYLKRYGL